MIRLDDIHIPPRAPIETEGMFDVRSADKERLAARLGGQAMTERAAGRDESLLRDVQAEIKSRQVQAAFKQEFEKR